MNVRKPESTREALFPSIPIGKPVVPVVRIRKYRFSCRPPGATLGVNETGLPEAIRRARRRRRIDGRNNPLIQKGHVV
jgi:hypothetical protein